MKNIGLFERSKKNPEALNIWSIVVPILFYLVCGALLIFLKDQALTIASYVLSGALLVVGIWQIVVYLRSVPIRRITESRLAIGLVLVLTGGLLAFNPGYVHELFPIVWGLALLFGAFLKIQYAFDEMSLKIRRWWILLIFAAVSIFTGILALLRPDFLGENKELIVGIMLIVEAALDLTVSILLSRAMKRHASAGPSVNLTPPAAEEPVHNLTEGISETAAEPSAAKPERPEASNPADEEIIED